MNEKRVILVIEDEHTISNFICRALSANDYKPIPAFAGKEGLSLYFSHGPDLVLLDLGLPDMDGIEVLQELSGLPQETPVIIISARDRESEKVKALDMGADDYIAKPFSIREVLARVRSVLRRTAQPAAEEKAVAFEGLRMDLTRKVCTIDGEPLALTKKEFEILALLLSSRGKIFSREEILRQVWSDEVIVLDRTIDVNITRLRRKIGPYGEHIVTRLGYGYGFEE